MSKNSKNLYYSPISHSNVALIYPWNNWTIDLLALIPFKKQRKKLISSLEKMLDHRNIFLTNSGSSALTLAIRSLRLPPNSEVLLTSFNCHAVIDSIISAGAIPVFIDINSFGGIDLKSGKKALSKKTKAIIVTNIYGLVDNLDILVKFCKNNNIFLITDLAQTFENINSTQKLNKFGDMSIYSFGSEKHLFSLGGGCLIVNNKSLIKQVEELYPKTVQNDAPAVFLQRLSYYGIFFLHRYFPKLVEFKSEKSASDIKKSHPIHIHQMNNSQLSSLVSKLKNYKKYVDQTKGNFERLHENLKYNILYNDNNFNSLPLYATIEVPEAERYKLAAYLDKHHVATTWNYMPLYYYDAYKDYKVVGNDMTEKLWTKVLSIPFRYPISTSKINKIIKLINTY